MKKWLVAIILGMSLVLGACGDGSEDTTSESDTTEPSEEADKNETTTEGERAENEVATAEELVKSNCASCHSGDFELVAGESDLTVDEIEDIIKNGVGSMPAIDVTDEEATMIAEYLAQE